MATLIVTPEAPRGGVAGGPGPYHLQDAIDRAAAGDTIILEPGVYRTPVSIRGKRGTMDAPITLRSDGSATLDGGRNVLRPPGQPTSIHFAFIKIINSTGIVIENATIQNAWPSAIYIEDSQSIVVRRMNLNGATYGIYARGETTRSIIVEHCSWIQDERIWDRVSWKDIHDPPMPRRELDGDFFRASGIYGDVVVRNNFIAQAFNGIHFFAEEGADSANFNRDVFIYRNTFAFIRDSAVEAEFTARNWFVFENVIYNCHTWFAFENCAGGHWYIFSNRGWFDRKPGPPGDCNSGGGVIKTNKVKRNEETRRLPALKTYMFHNSFYLRSSYMKKGKMKNFAHFNNAIHYPDAAFHPPGLVDPYRLMIGVGPPDPACDGTVRPDAPFTTEWERLAIVFKGDICNHRDYPSGLRLDGYPVEGLQEAPGFVSPRDGDFSLAESSPCTGSGIAWEIRLDDGTRWHLPAGKNVGAVKSGEIGEPYSPLDLNCPKRVLPDDYIDTPSARPWSGLDTIT